MTFTFKGAANTDVWTGVSEATPVVHTDFGKVETVEQRERDYWGFRRAMLGALTNIGATLCKLGGQQSIRDIQIALDKQQAAEDARLPADKNGRDAAYSWVAKAMIARGTRDHFGECTGV
jgi:hypothetical protein